MIICKKLFIIIHQCSALKKTFHMWRIWVGNSYFLWIIDDESSNNTKWTISLITKWMMKAENICLVYKQWVNNVWTFRSKYGHFSSNRFIDSQCQQGLRFYHIQMADKLSFVHRLFFVVELHDNWQVFSYTFRLVNSVGPCMPTANCDKSTLVPSLSSAHFPYLHSI